MLATIPLLTPPTFLVTDDMTQTQPFRLATFAAALLLCFCTAGIVPTAFAQKDTKTQSSDWKAYKRQADEQYEKGNYGAAAKLYQSAYEGNSKPEIAFKGGESFWLARDYDNAATMLAPIKDNKAFDKVGYKYALALKQSEQYEEAVRQFQYFINNYKGKDYDGVEKLVQQQIEGAQLGARFLKEGRSSTRGIQRLTLNSDKTDFAPTPESENGTMYYSSTAEGKAKIFKTELRAHSFPKGTVMEQLKGIDFQVANPTFTPDGNRMYFSECVVKDNRSTCQIYGMEVRDGQWQVPQRLPDVVNTKGTSNTQPSITIDGDKEYLYFASDRDGGQGGTDIWVSTRRIKSEGFEFTLPVNLGKDVNTSGDEVTPFFDGKANTLYFSSNRLTNIGGFDIFRTAKNGTKWSTPTNMEMPINSGADDLYYVPSADGAFITTNRLVDGKKSGADDDILFYSPAAAAAANATTATTDPAQLAKVPHIAGVVKDANNAALALANSKAVLYAIVGTERKEEARGSFADGLYYFPLRSNTSYRMEVEAIGYQAAFIEFTTNTLVEGYEFKQDIAMSRPTVADNTPDAEQLDPLQTANTPTDNKDPKTTPTKKTADVTPPPVRPTPKRNKTARTPAKMAKQNPPSPLPPSLPTTPTPKTYKAMWYTSATSPRVKKCSSLLKTAKRCCPFAVALSK